MTVVTRIYPKAQSQRKYTRMLRMFIHMHSGSRNIAKRIARTVWTNTLPANTIR